MPLMCDYSNNSMQDSQEYAFNVIQKLQGPYNPQKVSVQVYIDWFNIWQQVHQGITR